LKLLITHKHKYLPFCRYTGTIHQ